MRPVLTTILVVALAGATAPAAGTERLKTAVLPVKVVPKKLPKSFHPGEYVFDRMIIGLTKVERFDVLVGGDVDRLLEDHLIKTADVKVANADRIAKALKVRLLLFARVDGLTLEVETEDRVLIQTKTAVCTATVGATLYDATTGRSTRIGPYIAEERKVGSQDQLGRMIINDAVTEKMMKKALDATAKKVRARIYKLHPLAGKVLSVDGKTVTIDIGTRMGVAVKHTYAVFGMVSRENPVTGLPETTREEIAVIEVVKVTETSATCKVVGGDGTATVGSTVARRLKRD